MTSVVAYLRVSRDTDKRHRSVTEQDTDCRTAAADRDLGGIAEVFVDDDLSASEYATKDRPGFASLRRQVAAGRVGTVVVWEGSRLSRVMSVYVDFRDLCRSHGTGVLVVDSDRLYDFSRARDRRDFLDEGGDAEHESAKSSRRIQRAVAARAAEGKVHGKLLYGYTREYNPRTGQLIRQIPAEDQAARVREAAARVAAGEPPSAVADDLNRRGVPAPRDRGAGWDLVQVKRMVTNPAYIGVRVHKGEQHPAQWPPIVDEATFAACARLHDPARRTTRDRAVKHLLSGIAVCDVCGGPVRVMPNRGYPSYVCFPRRGRDTRRSGFHVARRVPVVDAYVTEVLFAYLMSLRCGDWIPGRQNPDAAAARAEAASLRARLDAAADAYARDTITITQLTRITSELQPGIDAADERGRNPAVPTAVADLADADVTAGELAAAWDDLGVPQRREVIRSLLTIRIRPVGSGRRGVPAGESVEVLPRR